MTPSACRRETGNTNRSAGELEDATEGGEDAVQRWERLVSSGRSIEDRKSRYAASREARRTRDARTGPLKIVASRTRAGDRTLISPLIPSRSFAALVDSVPDAGVEVRFPQAKLRGARSWRLLRLMKAVLDQRWRGMSHRWCRRRVSDRSGWRGPRVIPARSYILLGSSRKQKNSEQCAHQDCQRGQALASSDTG